MAKVYLKKAPRTGFCSSDGDRRCYFLEKNCDDYPCGNERTSTHVIYVEITEAEYRRILARKKSEGNNK